MYYMKLAIKQNTQKNGKMSRQDFSIKYMHSTLSKCYPLYMSVLHRPHTLQGQRNNSLRYFLSSGKKMTKIGGTHVVKHR